MTKNSLKTDPDELGYYGEGDAAMGGMAVGETLMPALHELSIGFEEAIKDKEFLDEYAYYCKHYIGRPSPLYYAENLTKKLGGAKILFKQEHLNHTGSHKINNSLFQVLLAKRMGKTHLICESGAGQHFSATAAVAAKFNMPLIGVMGDIDIKRVNQNIIKAKHYGAKLEAVPGTLKEAITSAIKIWSSNPEYAYICGSAVSSAPFPKLVAFAQSIIGKEIREQSMDQEGKIPDMIVGCVGGGSNFAGAIYEFLDEPNVKKIGVEAAETAALSNGTPGIMQGMKTYMLQTDDGAKSLGGMSLGAGITYFSVGPMHSYLKDQKAVSYSSATDQEMLDAYKMIAQTEGICSALEPMAGAAEIIFRQAKDKPKDYIICLSLCGRGEKDLDTIQEHIGKDFE
ncbi:pyridoxal-phosphate dependent enzyme [Pelagibacterales bacterium SAG-MED27]|nr:pyridoxal-phosphate dependent enzyme [Pelagibacterales bacterium SAG-MED27]